MKIQNPTTIYTFDKPIYLEINYYNNILSIFDIDRKLIGKMKSTSIFQIHKDLFTFIKNQIRINKLKTLV